MRDYLRELFDLKKQKTPFEALVFFSACAIVLMVVLEAADYFLVGRM